MYCDNHAQASISGKLDSGSYGEMLGLLITAVERALDLQRSDGAMPPGHNGSYYDRETPVRNTAHWSIAFLAAWENTEKIAYLKAAHACADYLSSTANSSSPSPFFCRDVLGKDKTNGLIGQAWGIEALVELGIRLGRPDLLEMAETIFMLHPFQEREGGWQTILLNNQPSIFDYTFNHQLWFCAAGAMIAASGRKRPEASVYKFLDNLDKHLKLYSNGLICHLSPQFLSATVLDKAKGVVKAINNFKHRKYLYQKSVGYHAFNTYALSLIQRALPNINLDTKPSVSAALDYLVKGSYAEDIEVSTYGYPYNPPGFEAAFTVATFYPDRSDLIEMWLGRQINKTYNQSSNQFDLNTADPVTAAARVYEVARLYTSPIFPIEHNSIPKNLKNAI